MKKVLAVLIVIACLCFGSGSSLSQSVHPANGTYSLYFDYMVSCPEYCDVVYNGNGCIISCKSENAGILYSALGKNAVGESWTLWGGADAVSQLLRDLDYHQVSVTTTDSWISYGYSPKLGRGIKVNGSSVNCQIAFCGNRIVIGTPIILGSF